MNEWMQEWGQFFIVLASFVTLYRFMLAEIRGVRDEAGVAHAAIGERIVGVEQHLGKRIDGVESKLGNVDKSMLIMSRDLYELRGELKGRGQIAPGRVANDGSGG